MKDLDDGFFDRADEHITLSNRQMANVSIGKVSASMMYSVARFNAHVNSLQCTTADEMKKNKQKTVDYFVEQYRKMLVENIDDYIEHFQKYLGDDAARKV